MKTSLKKYGYYIYFFCIKFKASEMASGFNVWVLNERNVLWSMMRNTPNTVYNIVIYCFHLLHFFIYFLAINVFFQIHFVEQIKFYLLLSNIFIVILEKFFKSVDLNEIYKNYRDKGSVFVNSTNSSSSHLRTHFYIPQYWKILEKSSGIYLSIRKGFFKMNYC